MLRSPYRYISITLATGEVRTLPIYAPFVRLLDNSIAVDPEISIDGSFETFPAGLSLKLPSSENFTEISVRNPDVNPMTLVFAFASEEVTDTRLTLSGSTFTDLLNELQGDLVPENWGADTAVGLAAVQLFAANAARKSVLIQSEMSNTGIIYIGYDNTVANNKKICALLPGGAWSADDYRGPVFAIASLAAPVVSKSEV